MKSTPMQKMLWVLAFTFLSALLSAGQTGSAPSAPAPVQDDYSGMYTFLREGEFVQITVEDAGHVTGFVSRYGDSDSDQGAFLDHFFKQAKLEGNDFSFTTETVHGTWYQFQGKLDRGPAKSRAQEGYFVAKGTLTENVTDAAKKVSAKSRDVVFKLFPEDASAKDPAPPKRD
jgi:hypothetical protein